MTPRQRDVLLGVTRFLAANPDATPSVSELCRAVGLKSKGAMHDYLCRFEDGGFIIREPSSAGSRIKLTGKSIPVAEPYSAKRAYPPIIVDPASREAEYGDVARLLEEGQTHRQIARRLGRSIAYVSHVRAHLGKQVRTFLHLTDDEKAEIARRTRAGEAIGVIARAMNLSDTAVAEHMRGAPQ